MSGTRGLFLGSLGAALGVAEIEGPRFPVSTDATGCVVEPITSEPYDEFQFQGVSRDGEWLSYAVNLEEDDEGDPIRRTYLYHRPEDAPGRPLRSRGTDGSVRVRYRLAGSTRRCARPAVEFLPSYSPDGRRILFSSYRSGNSEIYLYERADGTLRRLTDNDACDAHAEFSGDGAKILFHRMVAKREDGGYDFDLHSYDGASGEERRLTSTPHEESYGSWAPDGSWTRDGEYVCFNSERRGTTDIFRMRMKGLDCERAGRAR